jgi:hypothetical protein
MKQLNWKALAAASVIISTLMGIGGEPPKGWHPAGSHPKDYDMSIDRDLAHSGKASASLKSIVSKTGGFGTLMQTFQADAFRGKRVRMSGYVRSKEVSEWAGLWMRVDGSGTEMLAFDNMHERPIKKTTDWAKYEIVLDVPESSEAIAFGFLLNGEGQVWMDDLKFEVVDKTVATTGSGGKTKNGKTPTNLGFEE